MLCLFEKFEGLCVKKYLFKKPLGVCIMHYTRVACNLTRDNSIVYGDGYAKVFCSMVVETSTNKILGVRNMVPMTLVKEFQLITHQYNNNNQSQTIKRKIILTWH
jgi:hypothetical protein